MILIVDDDPSVIASLALLLKQAGYASHGVAGPAAALAWLGTRAVRARAAGHELLAPDHRRRGARPARAIRAPRPPLPVVLITAWGSIGLAVEGMKAGAADFITKPWTNAQILQTVRTVLALRAAAGDRRSPLPRREELDARFDFGTLVGRDARLLQILQLIGRVAPTDAVGAGHRRERHGQGAGGRGHPPKQPPGAAAVREGEPRGHLGVAVRERDVRTREGRLHRRACTTARAGSRSRTAARSSSTRSATSMPRRRSRCCACCRTAPSKCSGRASAAPWTCVSSRPRTATSPRWSRAASSARTCSIASI